MPNVIDFNSRTKNYAQCLECGWQGFFMTMDDDDNITGSECMNANCRSSAEFDLDITEIELESDHYTDPDSPYP